MAKCGITVELNDCELDAVIVIIAEYIDAASLQVLTDPEMLALYAKLCQAAARADAERKQGHV